MQTFVAGFALLLAGLEGDVYVAGADTLVIAGTPVQLIGVDLPPSRVKTEAAREAARDLVEGQMVTCRMTGEKINNRMLGICFADGVDIGAELVAAGHLVACAEAGTSTSQSCAAANN